jgi:hypothetical protein
LRLLARKGGMPQSISKRRILHFAKGAILNSNLHPIENHGVPQTLHSCLCLHPPHPVLHQSTLKLCPLLSTISGAMYSMVPIKLLLRSLSPETLPWTRKRQTWTKLMDEVNGRS